MNKEKIIEILNEWNFWNKTIQTGVERSGILDKLLEFVASDKVISIVGVRRAGESTLVRQMAKRLIEKGVSSQNIMIVNFEEPMFENTDISLLLNIYQAYKEIVSPNEKPYIFLDEVQNI